MTSKAEIVKAEEDQSNLLKNIAEFTNKSRPRCENVRIKKRYLWKCKSSLRRSRINSRIFPIKATQSEERIKILTSKQMFQTLPTAFVQVKAGNTSENLLNEIYQIIYFLCWEKEITIKVHNNVMNSIKVQYKNQYFICEF